MPQKKLSGPMLFCEWVIGGPIPSARRASSKSKSKPKPREVIRVEVTTDDEAEEDTLKITYPRSGKTSKETAKEISEAVVKKVRFDEKTKKSSLKAASKESSEAETSSASEASAASSSEGEKTSSEHKKKNKKKDEKVQTNASSSSNGESEGSDSEPHPTCKCSRCVKQRKQTQEKAKKDKKTSTKDDDSAAEASDSAAEEKKQKHSGKEGKKNKEKDKTKPKDGAESEADDEASKPATKTKQKIDKKSQTKTSDNSKPKSKPEAIKPTNSKDPTKPPNPSYPSAYPAPHPRRPNLIAPIRAQVVQTEDVVETPDDPPPNAFYDAESNIMRVYYGPVYGNHTHRSLYPKRDSNTAATSLPVGMPHPTQNPYHYGGFQQLPPPQGYAGGSGAEHVPITQGMPWNPFLVQQPPGFPPFVNEQAQQTGGHGSNKGAFSKKGSPVATNISQAEDRPGQSNIAPSDTKASKSTSPYYKPSKTAEAIRNSASASPNNTTAAAADTGNGGWDNTPTNTQPPADSNAWPTTSQETQPAENNWGDNANDNAGWDNSGDTNAQSNGSNNNNNNNNNNNGSGGGEAWDNAASATSAGQAADEWNNNVGPPMPGGWEGTQTGPAAPAAAWGDASMAASTNGKIDGW